MTKDEAMRMALEALETERENYQDWDKKDGAPEYIHEAITALREALAQPEQEPVAVVKALPTGHGHRDMHYVECQHLPVGTKLYKSPPAQQEQVLTPLSQALEDVWAEPDEVSLPAQQEPVAWPIETNDQVEALAKQCGWNNRRYMTPADYQIWCDRIRQFVQLASPPANPADTNCPYCRGLGYDASGYTCTCLREKK